ncbi:MAG: crossover junction endodeoxyribonuclease RuvC [bacterium]|nr:crossover junction endodeoxyribonuclease RuvC [bacterium]
MTIISLDPGYDRLGVAVFTDSQLTFSTCLSSNSKDSFPNRLKTLGEGLKNIFSTQQPKSVAMEEIFFSQNQTTALKVAEVRGMIMYLAGEFKAEVYQYSPQAVKMGVAGYGNASKNQVTTMVKRLVKLPQVPQYDDEYDAIAVGLTHLAHWGNKLSTL